MTAPVHVIILAQGQQTRLPDLKVPGSETPYPKQLLLLEACADMQILGRTLSQLTLLQEERGERFTVTVVCGQEIRNSLWWRAHPMALAVVFLELEDPGNSSLKGISRVLQHKDVPLSTDPYAKTIVLLGDVLYSWHCLRSCFVPTHWNMAFVGTSDLSRSGGELWGINWTTSAYASMTICLARALAKHPPFEAYQCGQLRRWLWEIDQFIDGIDPIQPLVAPHSAGLATRLGIHRTWYRSVDDFTRDIDLPAHVELLPQLSIRAAEDDRQNGLIWGHA